MGRSIAFIDDDRGPTDYYVAAIEQLGFTVHHLDDYAAACEFIDHQWPVSAFVVDTVLPVPDVTDAAGCFRAGIRICRRIRSKYPETPIILLTNLGQSEDLQREISSLHLSFVSKFERSPHNFSSDLRKIVFDSDRTANKTRHSNRH